MSGHLKIAIEESLKDVLETKHLYQNYNVQLPEFQIIVEEVIKPLFVGSSPISTSNIDVKRVYEMADYIKWEIRNPYGRRGLPSYTPSQEGNDVSISIIIEPPTIKMVCPVCEDIEPYNFRHGDDLLKDFEYSDSIEIPKGTQVFLFMYQCQACKSIPEAFLIKRNNLRLMLSGRTPMEVVKTKPFIPKGQRKFFSNAIIAFNSGQVLAGNFLLRTFVEQYVRSKGTDTESKDIDGIFKDYNNSLPDDFRQRFPSLKNIYDKLSDDIHGAIGSEIQFQEAKQDIETHFDAKRIYKIV